MIDHEAQHRYNAKMKYKGKLITYGEFIEILKLQLEVQKELYRLECEKI